MIISHSEFAFGQNGRTELEIEVSYLLIGLGQSIENEAVLSAGNASGGTNSLMMMRDLERTKCCYRKLIAIIKLGRRREVGETTKPPLPLRFSQENLG